MVFTHALQFVIVFVVSTIIVSLAAGFAFARTAGRRRFDLGVVSQRWLLTHRAED